MRQTSLSRVVFVGSFDPFHDGHRNIVERALKLFDEVLIGVSQNDNKTHSATIEERVKNIRQIYHEESRVIVEANNGLTIDFARAHAARCIIKGIRNVEDFEDERKQALWNKKQGGIDTLLFIADEDLEGLSSTSIRAKDKKIASK